MSSPETPPPSIIKPDSANAGQRSSDDEAQTEAILVTASMSADNPGAILNPNESMVTFRKSRPPVNLLTFNRELDRPCGEAAGPRIARSLGCSPVEALSERAGGERSGGAARASTLLIIFV